MENYLEVTFKSDTTTIIVILVSMYKCFRDIK